MTPHYTRLGREGQTVDLAKPGTIGHASASDKPYSRKASFSAAHVIGKMNACVDFVMRRMVQAPGGGAFVEFERGGERVYMHCKNVRIGPSGCAP